MHYNYKCPGCDAQLRIGDHVLLTARDKTDKGSIIMLHAEPGNYKVDFHPDIEFEQGEKVTFLCPVCHCDLSSEKHANLAQVTLVDHEGNNFDIYFSKIAGEHSTIKMAGEHVELIGPHSDRYMDFFSMSQLY